MTMDPTATIVGHALLFLTTIAGFVFQWFREERRHRWAQEQFQAMKTEIRNGNGKH